MGDVTWFVVAIREPFSERISVLQAKYMTTNKYITYIIYCHQLVYSGYANDLGSYMDILVQFLLTFVYICEYCFTNFFIISEFEARGYLPDIYVSICRGIRPTHRPLRLLLWMVVKAD